MVVNAIKFYSVLMLAFLKLFPIIEALEYFILVSPPSIITSDWTVK
uniref:Uncharacterized protein n=1 Tax=Tetranychus urticae TaxID=32264 RepID=T1JVU5_TETUR